MNQIEDMDGVMCSSESDMARAACDYFDDLFTTRGREDVKGALFGVDVHVIKGMNNFLCLPFTEEEIGMAIRSIHPTKASGSDGLSALFYHKFWHIIGVEVSSYCLNILNHGVDMVSINNTNVVLISKQSMPTCMTHF